MKRQPCVYILASAPRGTLYIGVTSRPVARWHEHRTAVVDSFTARHAVHLLVFVEFYEDMPTAIAREKQLKAWRRDWKLNLIERLNPCWNDLAPGYGLPPLDLRHAELVSASNSPQAGIFSWRDGP